MTEKPYTNADVETVTRAMMDSPTVLAHQIAASVLDALTAAGWQPPGQTTGCCGHQMPNPIQAFGDTTPILCELPAGHAGWHRSGVTEWGAYMRRPRRDVRSEQAEG
jgi:hypothetical protein